MTFDRLARWGRAAAIEAALKRPAWKRAFSIADELEASRRAALAYRELQQSDMGARWRSHIADCHLMAMAERLSRSDIPPATRIALLATQETT